MQSEATTNAREKFKRKVCASNFQQAITHAENNTQKPKIPARVLEEISCFSISCYLPPSPFNHKQKQQSKIVSRGKGLNSTRFMHELILPALCVAAVKLLLHVTYATKCRVRACVCVRCMCVCVCRIPQQRLLTVYSLQQRELRCKVCNKFSHCLCAARVGRGAVGVVREGAVGWRVAHT